MSDTKQQIDDWCSKVLDGTIAVSRFVRMAVLRQINDLQRKDFPWVFDEQLATAAVNFFPTFLVHIKGQFAGKPFELSPSQKFIVWCLFGWRCMVNGTRRFKRLFITVARKWGKSTFAAGLALLLLFADCPIEVDAEGYVAATKEDQAAIVHTIAAKMLMRNEYLSKRAKVFKNRDKYKSILLEGEPYNGSVFKPIGSDSVGTDGLNPHFVIKDELHQWQPHHKGLKEKLETGGGSRLQSLDITISTNGDERSEFFKADLTAATNMLEASERGDACDERLFAFVCMLDDVRPCECDKKDPECTKCLCTKTGKPTGEIPADDIFDEANWPKANPDIGITPTWEYLSDQAERAKREPTFLNSFKRYHCNLEVSSRVKLLDAALWKKRKIEPGKVPWSKAESICGAFDIGWRDDFAAIGVTARFNRGKGQGVWFAGLQIAFCCEDGIRNLNNEPFATWIKKGWLIPTPGNTTDITLVRDYVLRLSARLGVRQWRYDSRNALQLGTELQNEHGMLMVEFQQTHGQYNEPLREFIKQVKDGSHYNLGDECLTWMVGNAVGVENARKQIMPDKAKSKEKIDGFVTQVMSFSGVMPGLEPVQKSSNFYETNELEVL